jgi:hypothetical protein
MFFFRNEKIINNFCSITSPIYIYVTIKFPFVIYFYLNLIDKSECICLSNANDMHILYNVIF